MLDAEILCTSAEGFPCFPGCEGLPVLHCCVLGLEGSALQQAECSEAGRPCSSRVPTGSMTQHSAADGVGARWCLIALGQALMQNQEPSGVTVQIFNSLCYVDVVGLPPTLPCPVANLLCHVTGDNSDAIGRQLCFLTSGRGVQQ